MSGIEVTKENCEKVGRELLQRLTGCNLTIVSFYADPNRLDQPSVIQGVKVSGGFAHDFEKGTFKIELSPRRNIFWDSVKEKVTVTYLDDGVVVIQRSLPMKKAIQRVVICS